MFVALIVFTVIALSLSAAWVVSNMLLSRAAEHLRESGKVCKRFTVWRRTWLKNRLCL